MLELDLYRSLDTLLCSVTNTCIFLWLDLYGYKMLCGSIEVGLNINLKINNNALYLFSSLFIMKVTSGLLDLATGAK